MKMSEEDMVAYEEGVELLEKVRAIVRKLEFSAIQAETLGDEEACASLLKKAHALRNYFLLL